MNWKDADLPALQELEAAVLAVWKTHSDMNDYAAGRAYEAAHQIYRARARGREPRPAGLDGLDRETFDAVQKVCEKLLASGPNPLAASPQGPANPVALGKLVEYLRELARSVERHTKLGGRRGYLEFIAKFIPAG
ncbi:MAG: hypothetical protein ABSH48_05095 [Verrucomicrobiota bacterium]